MAVQGNRETYGNDGSPYPVNFVSQFNLPKNEPAKHIGQTYSYNYGCCIRQSGRRRSNWK